MRQGITVWLDVPLEALAARVVAVGTESRPLLGQASDDCYSQVHFFPLYSSVMIVNLFNIHDCLELMLISITSCLQYIQYLNNFEGT